jgi:hypothetical protein
MQILYWVIASLVLFGLYAGGFFNKFLMRNPSILLQYTLNPRLGSVLRGNISLSRQVDYIPSQSKFNILSFLRTWSLY